MSLSRRQRASGALTPREYEATVAAHFRRQGYAVKLGAGSSDWGVDVLASKGDERLAIQAKMYGRTTRRVNREMVMQLHGAKDYFDCTLAVLVTDGDIAPDARSVAAKLGIQVVRLPAVRDSEGEELVAERGDDTAPVAEGGADSDAVWSRYVVPLAGKTVVASGGRTNGLLKVDWSGVRRITSNGREQFIKIEVFRWAVRQLLSRGWVLRSEINEHYVGRASSGVVLILAQVPLFECLSSPSRLVLRGKPVSSPRSNRLG